MVKQAKKTIEWPDDESPADFLDFLNSEYGTVDSDNDGIADEVELMLGTDPENPDSDNDGVSDGEEVKQGRNPLGSGSFKDFFLAHEGNNFHPHALHPKRVAFYVLSGVLIKAMVFVFALGIPAIAWLTPDILTAQAKKIINLTNDLRSEFNLPVLAESKALNQAAYAKAEDMLLNQYFAHVSPAKKGLADWLKTAGYRFKVAGENLAIGFETPEAVLAAWQKSPTHNSNLIDPDYQEIGVGAMSGAYQDETTVVIAQMFGSPTAPLTVTKAEIKPQETTVAPPTPSVEGAKTVTLPQAPVKVPLLKPEIKAPEEIIKNSVTEIKISAPGAETVEIFLNGDSAGLADRGMNWEFSKQVALNEGVTLILAKAVQGKASEVTEAKKVTVDLSFIRPDLNKSSLRAIQVDENDWIVSVETSVAEAEEVILTVAGRKFNLTADQGGRWFGRISGLGGEEIKTAAIAPAVLTVIDRDGGKASYDLGWTALPQEAPGALKQYLLARTFAGGRLGSMFTLSDLVYKTLLALSCLTLIIALAFNRRRVHARVFGSAAVAIVAFAILLII